MGSGLGLGWDLGLRRRRRRRAARKKPARSASRGDSRNQTNKRIHHRATVSALLCCSSHNFFAAKIAGREQGAQCDGSRCASPAWRGGPYSESCPAPSLITSLNPSCRTHSKKRGQPSFSLSLSSSSTIPPHLLILSQLSQPDRIATPHVTFHPRASLGCPVGKETHSPRAQIGRRHDGVRMGRWTRTGSGSRFVRVSPSYMPMRWPLYRGGLMAQRWC